MKSNEFLSMFIVFLILVKALSAQTKEIALSDSEWNYGAVTQGELLRKDITISNNTARTFSITIIPACAYCRKQDSLGRK